MVDGLVHGIGMMRVWAYGVDWGARTAIVCVQCALSGLFFLGRISAQRFARSVRLLFWIGVSWFVSEAFCAGIAYFGARSWGFLTGQAMLDFAELTTASCLVGISFFFVFALCNDLSRGRFFYEDEEYNAGIAVLANPWPQSLLAVLFVAATGVVLLLVRGTLSAARVKDRSVRRLDMRMLLPMAGVVMLVLGALLCRVIGLSSLRV